MDARTVADVEGWESRPFGGGYDGLHDLASREFTGCVVAGDTYLFMIRGRVVGVFDYTEPAMGEPSVEPADIDRFEGADGTAYEAPEPALALLYAMAASGGETRGRYYSNDTPLEEVDRTLRDGGFTGYLELSENVLSGDYYLVYHGGRRRSVAFVGQSRRLKADDEAFDLAAEEVGIYEVTAVPFSPVEIPGSPGGGTTTTPAAGPDPTGAGDDAPSGNGDENEGSGGGAGTDDPVEADLSTALDEVDGPDATEGSAAAIDDTGDTGDTGSTAPEFDLDAAMNPRTAGDPDDATGADTTDEDDADNAVDTDEDADAGETPPAGPSPTSPFDGSTDDDADATADVGSVDTGDPDGADTVGGEEADVGASGDTAAGGESGAERTGADEESTVESAVSAVPEDEEGPGEEEPDPSSSDPSETPGEATPEDVEAAAAAAEAEIEEADERAAESDAGADRSGATGGAAAAERLEDPQVVPSVDPERTARAEPPEGPTDEEPRVIDGETVSGLRSELSAREDRIEELRERLEAVETERDRLSERVSELEARLAETGSAPLDADRELSPAEALSGTSILVRYRSKSEPTLEEALGGEADREALSENLTLEPHATFDTEGVSVSGKNFEAFLEGTQGNGFLRWLVGELPFEIRDTGSTAALEPLYDALPSVDRVEFDATVTLEGTDRETVRFDLVARDRRGNPLFVAHLEDDRAPTVAATMGEFLTDATAAAESHESLVAAFAVTASYFEPEALSTAEDATGGSLLSRSKRKSFVKTSRKGGYHLCLVEDREQSFYLSVPDL